MNEERGLDHDATQQILKRAIDLDAAAQEELKPEQIRVIAAELGISPGAIERALAEHQSALPAVDQPVRAQPLRPAWQRVPQLARVVAMVAGLYILVAVGVRLFP